MERGLPPGASCGNSVSPDHVLQTAPEGEMTVEWRNLDSEILKAIAGLEEHGFKEPTIRSVYYVLGSVNTIPLTRSG